MIIDQAICRGCGKLTHLLNRSSQQLRHKMSFVCEYCHTINHVAVREGTIAVPAVFREAFHSEPPLPDDKQENEQTLTMWVTVRSKELSNEQLKEMLAAVYYSMALNSKGYLYAICRLENNVESEVDFVVEFDKEIDG